MWWGTLWLTAVLISNSASKVANTIPEEIVLPDGHITPNDNPVTSVHTTVDTARVSTVAEFTESITESIENTTNTTQVSEETSTSIDKSDESSDEHRTSEQRTSEETDDINGVGQPPSNNTEPEDEDNSVKPSSETSDMESRSDSTEERSSHAESIGDNISANSEVGQIDSEDLVVTTKSGPVQGYKWQDKENIISYIDIPYGSIDNIFQAATARTWETLHDEKDHNKRCPQLEGDTYVGDIDCLTLSIFKPLNAENASVLFHIHAENFNTGSGDPSIYGPDYLVSNGIIVVLPNYRLGPLGFLCTQNETAPGNMALKDLSLALSWIHNNIQAFGGNPGKIAVSGEGRSGALAGLLALSPMSKDYVSKVIAESGSFLSYWALDRDPTATAAELFDKIRELELNIDKTDSDIKSILTAAKGLDFRPCLEVNDTDTFISATAYETVTSETFNNTSFLIGSAMYAGVHEALLQTEDSIKKINEDFTLLLPNDLSFETVTLRSEVGQRVKKQYFGDEDISLKDVKHLSLCFTDIGYLGPGVRSARLLVAAGATVYFYEFAYVGNLNRILESVNHAVEGAVRGDIIGYLFTQDGVGPGEELSEESRMVERLTKMWTNFLTTGTPSTEDIEWNSLENNVESVEEEWLLIDKEPSLRKGIHVERMPLWTEIYQNHYIDANNSYYLSPSVYTVLILQIVFWLGFCRNASHIY